MYSILAPHDPVQTVDKTDRDDWVALTELPLNEEAIVCRITASDPIRSRLFSLGCLKGARIKLKGHTLSRHTYKIEIDGTNLGLRVEEARTILVRRGES